MTALRFVMFVLERGEWRRLEVFDGADKANEALKKSRDMYLLQESLAGIVLKEQTIDEAGAVTLSRVILERSRTTPMPPLPVSVELPNVAAAKIEAWGASPIPEKRNEPVAPPPTPPRRASAGGGVEPATPSAKTDDDDGRSPESERKDVAKPAGIRKIVADTLKSAQDVAAASGKWLVLALVVVAIAFGLSLLGLWLPDDPRLRFLTSLVPATLLVGGAYAAWTLGLLPLLRRRRLALAELQDRSKEIFAVFAEYPKGLLRAVVEALQSDKAARLGRLVAVIPAVLGSLLVVWLGYLLVAAVMRHLDAGDLEAHALPLAVLAAMVLACLIVTIWFWRMMAPERPASVAASVLAKVEGKDLAAMLAHGPLTDGTMYQDARDTLLFVHETLTRHAKAMPGFRWNADIRERLFAFVVGSVELYCGEQKRSTAHTAVVLARVLGNLGHSANDVARFMASLPQLTAEPARRRAFEAGRKALADWRRNARNVGDQSIAAFGQILSG